MFFFFHRILSFKPLVQTNKLYGHLEEVSVAEVYCVTIDFKKIIDNTEIIMR